MIDEDVLVSIPREARGAGDAGAEAEPWGGLPGCAGGCRGASWGCSGEKPFWWGTAAAASQVRCRTAPQAVLRKWSMPDVECSPSCPDTGVSSN